MAFRREQTSLRDDYESDYRMIAADGRVVWFHDVVHVVRGPAGPEKLQGFLLDVTERNHAAEEHARLAAIVESSNDAIIGETLEGLITSWNQSAERIYGYTSDEVLGRSVRMLVPRERAEEVQQILAEMKRGDIIEQFETVRVRKDGRPIHVSLVVSPIRSAQGKIIGASAIARDITERKQLEAEVLQISEREQQRIARDLHDGLGQLLSGTVHLANVLQLELAEQAQPEASEALRITELLNQAVAETRSLARGLFPVRPEANGLMVALEDLAARTRELFKVACSLQCRKPVLIRDNAVATHLYRIAQEAVTNALKHGRARRIQLALHASPERIVLSVRDDGVGFASVSPSRRGMGIRIMKYRAGMLGGTLSIDDRAGHGVKLVCSVHRRATGIFEPRLA
jgi:PAS domain S-box-containing protein